MPEKLKPHFEGVSLVTYLKPGAVSS